MGARQEGYMCSEWGIFASLMTSWCVYVKTETAVTMVMMMSTCPPGQLVTKGRAELRQLASRLLALFPSLLAEENVKRVRLRSSSKHRCVSSVEAFQEGLWGRSGDHPGSLQSRQFRWRRLGVKAAVVSSQTFSTTTSSTTSCSASLSTVVVTWRVWRRTAAPCRRWTGSSTARRWKP